MRSAYSGCFICGDKTHSYVNCPQRGKGKKGGQKGFMAMSFMINGNASASTGPLQELRGTLLEHTKKFQSELESAIQNLVEKSDHSEVAHRECTAWATLRDEARGMGVIDCGATETIGSLQALQDVFEERVKIHGPQKLAVHPEIRTNFRFGNGASQYAESLVDLEQTIDGHAATLSVHSLDAEGVPILISIKDLKALGAVIDFQSRLSCLAACSSKVFRLKEATSGHLLLDLCRDMLGEGQEVTEVSSAMLAVRRAAAAEGHTGASE